MFGVTRRDGHSGSFRDGGDEGVIEGCVLGNPIGREDPGRRQVERQHPVGKGGQDILLEPATQDGSLLGVSSLLDDHSALDLRDGEC